MLTIDNKQFIKDMNNIVNYSYGFLEGAQRGKTKMLSALGLELKELVGQFIDSSARTNPASLHHVYEWYQVGSPAGRLFDIDYTVSNVGLSFYGTLSQSKSIKEGSKVPFYNKARIMESGAKITIRPKNSNVLVFDVDGKEVFTRKPVTVSDPGGPGVAGSFHEVFKQFFVTYLSQALLDVSGLMNNLQNPIDFKINLAAGKRGGRAVGIRVGAAWINKGVSV